MDMSFVSVICFDDVAVTCKCEYKFLTKCITSDDWSFKLFN